MRGERADERAHDPSLPGMHHAVLVMFGDTIETIELMSIIPDSNSNVLTLAEANAALLEVVKLVEQLQQLQRAMLTHEQQREELTNKLSGGNGHSKSALQDQIDAGIAQHDQLVAEGEDTFDRLNQCGAMLKDLESGLIDFYGERNGAVILLCWRQGEALRVQYWHTLEGGFAGRQPVDDLIR